MFVSYFRKRMSENSRGKKTNMVFVLLFKFTSRRSGLLYLVYRKHNLFSRLTQNNVTVTSFPVCYKQLGDWFIIIVNFTCLAKFKELPWTIFIQFFTTLRSSEQIAKNSCTAFSRNSWIHSNKTSTWTKSIIYCVCMVSHEGNVIPKFDCLVRAKKKLYMLLLLLF